MKTLRILVVDDHALFREGLLFLLKNNEQIQAVEEARNGHEFLQKVDAFQPDIVLMDMEMPVMNGIEATTRVLERIPALKIIALSMYSNENFYSEMIEAGAKGFLLKNSKFEEVISAITEVWNDRNYFSPEILSSIIRNLSHKQRNSGGDELTRREVEILLCICQGLSNQSIADKLFISKRTVDKHRENILLKTRSGNTAEMVVYAIKNGYFEI